MGKDIVHVLIHDYKSGLEVKVFRDLGDAKKVAEGIVRKRYGQSRYWWERKGRFLAIWSEHAGTIVIIETLKVRSRRSRSGSKKAQSGQVAPRRGRRGT